MKLNLDELINLDVRGLLKLQEQGIASAVEIVGSFHKQIEQENDSLNAILATDFDSAIQQARQVDENRAAGKAVGSLAGIPVVVKDCICTQGITSTAGSKILERFVPPYDATVVERLKASGAVILAKSHMDEFAMGGSNENPHFGAVHNPWNHDCVSGGSSGGSAVAVVARMSPLALGSDTGGSIRQPAAFCGITGLKPTYGRVSRFGLIAFASSLDQIGPMARSAVDVARLANVISGPDKRDSTSANRAAADFSAELETSLAGKRIGICTDHLGKGVAAQVVDAVNQAVAVFESLGAEIVETGLPHTKYAVAAYYLIAPCEASSNLARYDGVRYTTRVDAADLGHMYGRTRAQCFGAEVKRRIMLGTFALSSGYYDQFYLQASKVRRLIKQDYDKALERVDLILGPTTPTAAFRIGELIDDPLSMYLADVFTVSANLAGIPAISFPGGFTDGGLPIGLQLQARSFEESLLLNAAHQFQLQTDWHQRRPA